MCESIWKMTVHKNKAKNSICFCPPFIDPAFYRVFLCIGNFFHKMLKVKVSDANKTMCKKKQLAFLPFSLLSGLMSKDQSPALVFLLIYVGPTQKQVNSCVLHFLPSFLLQHIFGGHENAIRVMIVILL